MKYGKITMMMAAALTLGGIAAPTMAPVAATEQDQQERDRTFAEKLKALKDRQHAEWKELMNAQFEEISALKSNPDANLDMVREKHNTAKDVMKKRHRTEMQSLKAQYKG